MGKKILFVTRYYPPEIGVAGVCVSEFATRLAQLGHDVTVLTTVPNYPTGVVPLKYRGRLLQEEMVDGVRVVRTWCYVAPNKGFGRRILAQFSFGLTAPLLGARAVGHQDVVITGSPPLFNAIAGRFLAFVKRCPHIFWVADIWPESAIQLGVLHNRLLIWLAELLEWSTYQRACLVWVVTKGMAADLHARGLTMDRMLLITNGVDCQKFAPASKEQARAELGWDERFTVTYAGGHGLYHGLYTLLDAAELLRDQPGIRLVLVGDGSEKANLIALARQRNLTNITFLDAQPHARMPLFLNASDVCLMHVRDIPLFHGMLPVKMYEAMACARPMILALNGAAPRLAASEIKAALHVRPEHASELAEAVRFLYAHPEETEQMGQCGREYVLKYFDYQQLVSELHHRLEHLLVNLPEVWSAAVPASPMSVDVD